MLIDTHCHLNFQAFSKDLDDVVRRSQEAEVEKIIIPGTDLTSSKRAVEIAKTCANCFAAVGIHPHHAKDQNLVINEDLRHRLYQLLTQPKVVAAGEIGLDYHVYKSSKYTANEITDEYKEKHNPPPPKRWPPHQNSPKKKVTPAGKGGGQPGGARHDSSEVEKVVSS